MVRASHGRPRPARTGLAWEETRRSRGIDVTRRDTTSARTGTRWGPLALGVAAVAFPVVFALLGCWSVAARSAHDERDGPVWVGTVLSGLVALGWIGVALAEVLAPHRLPGQGPGNDEGPDANVRPFATLWS